MDPTPNLLTLPATRLCPFPPRLYLNLPRERELANSVVLSLPRSSFDTLMIRHRFAVREHEVRTNIEALKHGKVPKDGIPLWEVMAGELDTSSHLGLLSALAYYEIEALPVLATLEAAKILHHDFEATPNSDLWLLSYEPR